MNQPLTAPRRDTRVAPLERPRHLEVVGPRHRAPSRVHRTRQVLVAAGAALVVALAFSLVYLHVVMAQKQIRIDQLNSQVAQRERTYQQLRLQVAKLGSPQQIISTAEGRLGMRQPASVTYLRPAAGTPSVSSSSAGPGAPSAPRGDANWPQIKAALAGQP